MQRPRREKDSPSPCFDSRHTFVPVVAPPGAVADTRLYLEPASAVGRQERAERFTRDYLPDGETAGREVALSLLAGLLEVATGQGGWAGCACEAVGREPAS